MTRHTRKIEHVLREAAAAVAAADVPEDLRSVAFGKAVDLIVGVPPAGDETTGKREAPDEETGSSDDPLQKIATRFETDLELIDESFEVEDDEPKLTMSRSKLASSKKGATKQIALLVAAARQAAAIEQWTESKVIRDVVEGYGRLNSPNFAVAISELDDDFSFSGTGQNRKVKVRRDGFKRAGGLIQSLQGNTGG